MVRLPCKPGKKAACLCEGDYSAIMHVQTHVQSTVHMRVKLRLAILTSLSYGVSFPHSCLLRSLTALSITCKYH